MKLTKFRLTTSSVVNVVGAIIIAYLVVLLGQTIKRNYDLGRQIEALNANITQLRAQKDQLAYSIQYYKTDSFRDREARSQLGLQLPGENVIIIPQNSPAPTASANIAAKPVVARSNFQQWLDFLAGRN